MLTNGKEADLRKESIHICIYIYINYTFVFRSYLIVIRLSPDFVIEVTLEGAQVTTLHQGLNWVDCVQDKCLNLCITSLALYTIDSEYKSRRLEDSTGVNALSLHTADNNSMLGTIYAALSTKSGVKSWALWMWLYLPEYLCT